MQTNARSCPGQRCLLLLSIDAWRQTLLQRSGFSLRRKWHLSFAQTTKCWRSSAADDPTDHRFFGLVVGFSTARTISTLGLEPTRSSLRRCLMSRPGDWEPSQLREFRADFQADPALAAEVEGTPLLADVESFINRYVILPAHARLPIALWVMQHIWQSTSTRSLICHSQAPFRGAARRACSRFWSSSWPGPGGERPQLRPSCSGSSRRNAPPCCLTRWNP
jgi:hypothetical protein